MIVDRNPDGPRFAGRLQILQGAPPFVAADPLRIPDMQLLQIDLLQLQVPQARVGALHHVVVRKDLADPDSRTRRPDLILRRHFGRHVHAMWRILHHAAHQLLAVAISVSERGVDEIQSQLKGAPQRGDRFVVGSSQPHRPADAPGPVPDLTDLDACLPKLAITHSTSVIDRCPAAAHGPA